MPKRAADREKSRTLDRRSIEFKEKTLATDRIKTEPGFQPVMLAGVLGASAPGIKFATEPNSPFRDGYSIAGEGGRFGGIRPGWRV